MSIRDDRASAMLVSLAAMFIAREAGRETLITPTRAEYAKDRKHVTVFVSVFPNTDSEHAVAFLNRHRDDFRTYIKQEGRFGVLPFIRFAFDEGEQNRQRLDELSKEL